MARLKEYYVKEVAPALMKKFSYKSTMQIPKLDKIVVNVGAGEARENSKVIDAICKDLAAITGQKPLVIKSRKSISNFKLREGMKVGTKVTLRGAIMYEFLDRFFNIALPRVRDFQGIDADSFDGRGNFSTGLKRLNKSGNWSDRVLHAGSKNNFCNIFLIVCCENCVLVSVNT